MWDDVGVLSLMYKLQLSQLQNISWRNWRIPPLQQRRKRSTFSNVSMLFLALKISNLNNCSFIKHISCDLQLENLRLSCFFSGQGFENLLASQIESNGKQSKFAIRMNLMLSGNWKLATLQQNVSKNSKCLIYTRNYSHLNDAFELDFARCIKKIIDAIAVENMGKTVASHTHTCSQSRTISFFRSNGKFQSVLDVPSVMNRSVWNYIFMMCCDVMENGKRRRFVYINPFDYDAIFTPQFSVCRMLRRFNEIMECHEVDCQFWCR